MQFVQKEPIKVQILRFLSAQVKIRQITHVSFETTSQFLLEILHHSLLS